MKNKYEIRGGVTAIFLQSTNHGDMETLISTDKLAKAQELDVRWVVNPTLNAKNYYCQGSLKQPDGKWVTVILHRWLTDCPKGMQVDHFNHNTLDNTNENMRIVTRKQNRQNQEAVRSDSTTGMRNISCYRGTKWRVRLNVDGKVKEIGYFDSPDEAIVAERVARAKYYPFSIEAAERKID